MNLKMKNLNQSMAISKEKYLEELKDSVLVLKLKSKELRTSKTLFTKWNAKRVWIKENLENLSPEDRLWVEKEYSTWFKENIHLEKEQEENNASNSSSV